MLKILHCSDIHLGDLAGPVVNGENMRRLDTLKCMEFIVDEVKEEHPQIVIIAGDLFNRSRVWADTALEDINDAINKFITPLCAMSEHVILLFGTENHDNPKAFDLISQNVYFANLKVIKNPEVITLEMQNSEKIQIIGLPGFDKGRLRTFMPDVDKETENQTSTQLINEILLGLGTQIDKSIPSILTAHYTVAGCEADNGSTFLAGQDTVILPETIDMLGVDLVCLGHIHKPQKLKVCNTPTFYSGSINQLTFNDEKDEHGFYIHEMNPINRNMLNRFVYTPERRHCTVCLDYTDIDDFITKGELLITEDATDSIVRVRYDCSGELDKALNKSALQKCFLNDFSAFYVSEIIKYNTDDNLIYNESDNTETPYDALRRYLDLQGGEGGETERLLEIAKPLIMQADDGCDENKHTGAFVPKKITVKNYRSYKAAEFDFSNINMAMVNGQNGVGKSSLFMDAIADCLFEESRDGLGEWVREGEKSGSVIFEFSMGGVDYRVSRTRAKSGKGTLNFARIDDFGEWTDCGDTTMKLTQEKIERILGMDSQTFCSIALIRQDAYGLFLEAGSDRRMEVLSALLNLGIYSRLEDLARAEAADDKRQIAALKDRMNILGGQIAEKERLVNQQCDLTKMLDGIAEEIAKTERQIEDAQTANSMRLELIRQGEEKEQAYIKCCSDIEEKRNKLNNLISGRTKASELSAMHNEAENANTIISKALADLKILEPYIIELRDLRVRKAQIVQNICEMNTDLKRIETERTNLNSIITRTDEIVNAVEELKIIEAKREKLKPVIEEFERLSKEKDDIFNKRNLAAQTAKTEINTLTTKIGFAKKKAELLENSDCIDPDKANCKFLKDAVEARKSLDDLNNKLEELKNAARIEYDKYNQEIEALHFAMDKGYSANNELENLSLYEQELKPIAGLMPQLEAARAKIGELDRQELAWIEKSNKYDHEKLEIENRLPELEEKSVQAEILRKTIQDNEIMANNLVKCAAAKATLKVIEPQIESLTTEIETAVKQSEALKAEAENIRSKIPAEYDVQSRKNTRQDYISRQSQINSDIGGIKAKLEIIVESERQYNEYAGKVRVMSHSLADYETLTRAFGIDGIQRMVIKGVVPEITQRANDILSSMTGGRMAVDFRTEREQKSSSKIVNSLDVWINSINGGSRPYNSHSGGEKVKIALAVTLGLADVKARRAGVQLGMLFIDEPPFLDADGTEAYADALFNMAQRNPAMRILAISHDQTMKARFSQNITVMAGENGSEII